MSDQFVASFLRKALIMVCAIVWVGCASKKDFQTHVSKQTDQQQALEKQVESLQGEVATLTEELILLKGIFQKSDPVSSQAKKVSTVTEESFDDDRTPLFDDVTSQEQETLVITNKDVEGVTWGQESAPTPKRAKSNQPKIAYQKAYQLFQNKDYLACRQAMEAFIEQYPTHEHADNAHFWIGETYYIAKDYDKANDYYRKVIQNYPKGNKVPDAMLRSAQCSLNQKNPKLAQTLFGVLIEKHPQSVAASKAQKILNHMQSGRAQ